MFGTLRLVLAVMVALSHAGLSVQGYHLGVPAVVVFFLLSGYVVAGMLAHPPPLWHFYAERALRLLPPYYGALALGVVCWWAGVSSDFLQAGHQPLLWAAALSIVPLNYATLWPVLDTFTPVPPAWSLGLELQFYGLAPWLLARQGRIHAAILITVAVGGAAQLGLLPSDAWGYRLLAGNLYIFLSGAMLWRMHHSPGEGRAHIVALWLVVLGVGLGAGWLGRWGQPFVLEVTVGYVLGVPIIAALGALPRRAWDDRCADLAYPVFLLHFAVLWTLEALGHPPAATSWRWLVAYLGVTLTAAAALHWLTQRPVVAWRRRLRQVAARAPSQPESPP